ncbi:aldo/keto reductase [Microbacterium sp. NPDC090218]
MLSRAIGETGVALTELGFGAAGLGNLYTEVSEDDAHAAVASAWSRGIRYFDTAPHYGLGLSERRLGSALARYPREEYVVSTKVGRVLDRNDSPTGTDMQQGFAVPDSWRRRLDFSRDGVLRSLESSLDRLGLDYVDIVYVHDPELGERDEVDKAVEAVIELRSQGVIAAAGVGSGDTDQVERLLLESDLDLAMFAGRYTLLEQGGERALSAAQATGKSLVIAGAFNSGILANDRPPQDATHNYRQAGTGSLARANALADVCEEFSTTLPAAAIAFPLERSVVASVALGMRNGNEVERNLELHNRGVPEKLWAAMRERGLL